MNDQEEILDFAERLKAKREPDPEVSILRADGVRPEAISWLWNGWIARGKVHIVAGAPGTGKTTLAIALSAAATVAGRWPDGTDAPLGDVLIWSGEDDPKDTLVPRLIAAEADMSRVHFISGVREAGRARAFDPAQDAGLLQEAVANMDPAPALLIVDPIVSAVSGDSHKNAEVRRALQPLVELALTCRCAVLGITHFTKGTAGRDPIERVTGSLAFGALARVVMVAAKLPEEEGGGRILARAKSNIGLDGGGFGYDVDPIELPGYPGVHTTRLLWGEAHDGTAKELLDRAEASDDPEEQSARGDAEEFLLQELAHGPVPSKDLLRDARAQGIAERTLFRAKKDLGIVAEKRGFQGAWAWHLPDQEQSPPKAADQSPPKSANSPNKKTWQPSDDVAAFGQNQGLTNTPPTPKAANIPKAANSQGVVGDGNLGNVPTAEPADLPPQDNQPQPTNPVETKAILDWRRQLGDDQDARHIYLGHCQIDLEFRRHALEQARASVRQQSGS